MTLSANASVLSILILLLCVGDVYQLSATDDPETLLNYCLDTKHHKKKPGKEPLLFDQVTLYDLVL